MFSCPSGMTGDGYICENITTCQEMPCYPGVTCVDSDSGAVCQECPKGFDGKHRILMQNCRLSIVLS